MKYFLIDREKNEEIEVTREEAFRFIQNHYDNPEKVLTDFEEADGGLIRGVFRTLRLEKTVDENKTTDLDLLQISQQVANGNSSGMLDTEAEDGSYRITWRITIEKNKI